MSLSTGSQNLSHYKANCPGFSHVRRGGGGKTSSSIEVANNFKLLGEGENCPDTCTFGPWTLLSQRLQHLHEIFPARLSSHLATSWQFKVSRSAWCLGNFPLSVLFCKFFCNILLALHIGTNFLLLVFRVIFAVQVAIYRYAILCGHLNSYYICLNFYFYCGICDSGTYSILIFRRMGRLMSVLYCIP
jgi:hypothetical protein